MPFDVVLPPAGGIADDVKAAQAGLDILAKKLSLHTQGERKSENALPIVKIPVVAKLLSERILLLLQQIAVCKVHNSDMKPFDLETLSVGQIGSDF